LKKKYSNQSFFLNNPAAIYNQIIKWRKIGRKDYLYHLKKLLLKEDVNIKECYVLFLMKQEIQLNVLNYRGYFLPALLKIRGRG